MTSSPAVSVIVLAFNEKMNLPDCLESLRQLDCEIFVVDSGSTDGTREIATSHGAQVFEHPFENYAVQRNWAQQNLPLASNWVLHLDADERLTPELVDEINTLMQAPPTDVEGYLFRKRTYFMGRWIKHGGQYPSFHLRLFRCDRGRCEDRLYDQHFFVAGRVQQLQHDYVDILTSNLTVWTERHNRWAVMEARELLQKESTRCQVEANLFGSPIERRRWFRQAFYRHTPPFIRAVLYWFYRYMVRLGFLDGTQGMIFHFLQACWFRFLVDAKCFEFQYEKKLHCQTADYLPSNGKQTPNDAMRS